VAHRGKKIGHHWYRYTGIDSRDTVPMLSRSFRVVLHCFLVRMRIHFERKNAEPLFFIVFRVVRREFDGILCSFDVSLHLHKDEKQQSKTLSD
jgi:hypothetical protein